MAGLVLAVQSEDQLDNDAVLKWAWSQRTSGNPEPPPKEEDSSLASQHRKASEEAKKLADKEHAVRKKQTASLEQIR